MVYKAEGIILKKADIGGTDRLFWIYTKERGKILVRAKSVRKKESKLNGFLEIFNHCHFLLAQGKNMDTVTNVWPVNSYLKMRNNLPALWLAYYFVELVERLVVAPEPDSRIWLLLSGSLDQLENGLLAGEAKEKDLKKLARFFEFKLTSYLGYEPEINFKISNWQKFSVNDQQVLKMEAVNKRTIESLLDDVPLSAKFLHPHT